MLNVLPTIECQLSTTSLIKYTLNHLIITQIADNQESEPLYQFASYINVKGKIAAEYGN